MYTYICDIDGTICTEDEEYQYAEPIKERIEKMNELYDKGNEIIYFTARGSETGINWTFLTKKQLKDWGVKYTKLLFGKPYGDVYIDNKAICDADFFTNEN